MPYKVQYLHFRYLKLLVITVHSFHRKAFWPFNWIFHRCEKKIPPQKKTCNKNGRIQPMHQVSHPLFFLGFLFALENWFKVSTSIPWTRKKTCFPRTFCPRPPGRRKQRDLGETKKSQPLGSSPLLGECVDVVTSTKLPVFLPQVFWKN